MKKSIFRSLQRKIIAITLIVSLGPLFLLGGTIYYQFSKIDSEKTEEQIRYRAQSQAEAVDLFLKERTAILSAMADTHSFNDIININTLSHLLSVMNNTSVICPSFRRIISGSDFNT